MRELIVEFGGEQVPAGRGYIDAADGLIAALEGRWSDARAAMLLAEPILEAVGEWLMLARFRLALGHLAEGQFPEAAGALRQAEEWFRDLGATTYGAAYRAAAARGPASGAVDGPADPVESSTAVRAAR